MNEERELRKKYQAIILIDDTYRLKYQQLLQKNLEDFSEVEVLEIKWGKLKGAILEAAKGCCGIKKLSNMMTKKTGWWTEELQTKIKVKKMAWKSYLCTKCTDHYNLYKNKKSVKAAPGC